MGLELGPEAITAAPGAWRAVAPPLSELSGGVTPVRACLGWQARPSGGPSAGCRGLADGPCTLLTRSRPQATGVSRLTQLASAERSPAGVRPSRRARASPIQAASTPPPLA